MVEVYIPRDGIVDKIRFELTCDQAFFNYLFFVDRRLVLNQLTSKELKTKDCLYGASTWQKYMRIFPRISSGYALAYQVKSRIN